MASRDSGNITSLLAAWNAGNADALNRPADELYPEIRRIARQCLAYRRRGQSLETIGLANEACIKLVLSGGIRCEDRPHFLGLCCQLMRRIIVDHARRRGFARHGGGARRVSLDEVLLVAEEDRIDVLALHDAVTLLRWSD